MAELFGSVIPVDKGAFSFTYGNYGHPNYTSQHFSPTNYGSSAKAKAAALAHQKEEQPRLASLQKGSKYDKIYSGNKSFRDFVESLKKLKGPYKLSASFNWEELKGDKTNRKESLYKRFLNFKNTKTKAGYNTTAKELAEKLGLKSDYFSKRGEAVVRSSSGTADATAALIKKLFPKIASVKEGMSINLYKDPTPATIKEFKNFFSLKRLAKDTVKRVNEIDKVFREVIVTDKKLPDLFKVMEKTSANTPSKAASAMAVYSKVLRGEEFRVPINILKNNSAGERLITQLGDSSKTNAYRTAFYRLALDNVDKSFIKNGSLKDFKTNFNTALRDAMQLKKGVDVPYNINEVISLSAGESRGIRPFSVFVDATSANINQEALRNYQGQFSQRLEEVQKLLAKDKMPEARIAADKLIKTQKATAKTLLEQGFTKSQIGQLNLADIKVGTKIDPKIYTPEKLARWKEAGVDIAQFAKDKKFYIDIKKAKPFWESNVSNTVIAAARNNVGNICNIFKGKIAYSADGGRIGFQGGCGREMTVAMQTDSKGTLQQITKTEGIIPKFKNVAQGFLGALGKWGPKVGKYGAIAAAGALAQPLVKQFMNDDPSTYLTDPDQQAGMLEALIEGEQPKPRSEILDWGTTAGAVGATAAAVPGSGAMYKYRRGLSEAKIPKAGPITEAGLTAGDYLSKHAGKDYGKIRAGAGVGMKLLSGMFTPAGLLATEPFRIAQKRREGESWGDIATDPFTWMGPAFAPSMTRIATAGMKRGSLLPKLLRLGISSSRLAAMGPAGWAALVASLGWEGMKQYSDYKKHRGFFASEDRLGT